MIRILIVLMMLVPTVVQAQLDTVVGALAHANGVALSNPPMPSLYAKKNQYKLGLQMGILDGVQPASGDVKSLDYSGYNLAAMYNHMIGNFWGLYVLTSLSEVGGDITAPGQSSTNTIASTGLDSQLYLVSAGLTYNLFRNSWLSMPLLLGPAYLGGSFSGTFVQTDNVGTVLDDFDAEASPSYVGWMAGLQAAIQLHRHVVVIPYFLTLQPLLSSDKCQDFTATTVRTSGSLFDQSSAECEGGSGNNKSQLEFDVFVQAIGLNLAFPGIGLTFNLYSETGDVPLFDGASIDFYSVSFSLGIP